VWSVTFLHADHVVVFFHVVPTVEFRVDLEHAAIPKKGPATRSRWQVGEDVRKAWTGGRARGWHWATTHSWKSLLTTRMCRCVCREPLDASSAYNSRMVDVSIIGPVVLRGRERRERDEAE